MEQPCNTEPCRTAEEVSALIETQIAELKGAIITHIQTEMDTGESSLEGKIQSQVKQVEDGLRTDMGKIDFKIKALCELGGLYSKYDICQEGFDAGRLVDHGASGTGMKNSYRGGIGLFPLKRTTFFN